jgi:hypothetical protein
MKRRLLTALVLAAALLPTSALGAPGAADAGDCSPVGSYPGYTLVGTLFVSGVEDENPNDGYPPPVSFSGLVPGEYLIEASGTYCPGSPWESDAEWVRKGTGPWSDFVPGYETDPLGECLDELHVDGTCVEWSEGVFQPDHVYTLPWTISGDSLTLQIMDWYAWNNSGGLCVALFHLIEVVDIDIKPGSDPNCFNINGHGVIPVAINGSADFDVQDVNVFTLEFGGLAVRVKGNGVPQCSVQDWNEDTHPDLVCQFVDDASAWEPGDATATLTGELLDGTPIEGTDDICIVP